MSNHIFQHDNFNRANESLDASLNWVEREGDWSVIDNQVKLITANGIDVAKYDNTNLNSADYYVQVDILLPSSTTSGEIYGIIARQLDYSTSDSDGYILYIWPFLNQVRLYKKISGVITLLGSSNITLDINTKYNLKIKIEGSNIKAYIDNILLVEVTDTSITAKGSGGLYNHNVAVITQIYDNYEQGNLPITHIHINDAKYNRLSTILAKDGHIDDLELEWLQSFTGVTALDIEGAWHEFFNTLSIAAGNFNDRAFAWLEGLGRTGSLSDRWYAYWHNL